MKYKNLLLALLSGVLLWAAWPVSPFTFLIFVAWIPLLYVADTMPRRKGFFGLTYLTMLSWNLLATWWIWYATVPGSLSAFLVNSLLMCLPWMGYRAAARRWKAPLKYVAFVAFWMCFEYIHLQDWGLSWPWLTLGNVFASHPNWVQWYEITGTSGGTLWVLAVNILLYHRIFRHITFSIQHSKFRVQYSRPGGLRVRNVLPALAAIFLPWLLSILIKPTVQLQDNAAGDNVVVVQPNVDPYVKLSDRVGNFEGQLFNLISASEQAIDSNTRLLVWPETALYTPNGLEEDHMKDNFLLLPLWGFLKRHPNLRLFTGVESYRRFEASEKTENAKRIGNSDDYYESYNGAVLLDSTGGLRYYHKSMLVPGAETLPWFLKFLGKWFDKFGGTSGGYTKQNDRSVITTGRYRIASAICYESIYGEFLSRYITNGANIICIITNDGWWRNTPGHKQHMNYARLRAIETRKWVARSANTGISCFISPAGEVLQAQPYDTRAAIKMQMKLTEGKTFYVKYRDLVSKLACLVAAVLVIGLLILKFRKSKSTGS